MKRKFAFPLIALSLVVLVFSENSAAQETEVRLISADEFQLSSDAVAAGIDGKIWIGLTVNADGSGSDIRMYGGPMWPCGSKIPPQLDEVRRAVKEHVLSLKFEPARKNGKPRSSQVQMSFVLSDLFRHAGDTARIEADLKKGINPPMVEVGDLSKRAVDLPTQLMAKRGSPSARLNEMQLMVDETGKVVSAGGFKSAREDLIEAQKLACSAKFQPLTLNKKPVKMSGIILYGLY